jgi:hypothetical protein
MSNAMADVLCHSADDAAETSRTPAQPAASTFGQEKVD